MVDEAKDVLVVGGVIGAAGLGFYLWNKFKKVPPKDPGDEAPGGIPEGTPLDERTQENIVRESGPSYETLVATVKAEALKADVEKERLEALLQEQIAQYDTTQKEIDELQKTIDELNFNKSLMESSSSYMMSLYYQYVDLNQAAIDYKNGPLLTAYNKIAPLKADADSKFVQWSMYNYIMDNLTYGTGYIYYNDVNTGWAKTLEPITLTIRIQKCKDAIRDSLGLWQEADRIYNNQLTEYQNFESEYIRLDNVAKDMLRQYENYRNVNYVPILSQLAGAINLMTIKKEALNVFNDNIVKFKATLRV